MRLVEMYTLDTTGKYRATIFGDSSESKPTENLTDGSVFVETNTGKAFLFNEKTSTWVEQ